MTNSEIIMSEALANNIFTPDQIEFFLTNGMDIPLHTYAVWKAMGYRVKKGEHAVLTTFLWQPKKCKQKEIPEDEENEKTLDFIMCKAFLFSQSQVEKENGAI